MSQRRTPKKTNASCTHNILQHTTENIKHHHHGPPKPPASRGSNFTGECNCHMSHYQSRSLQHGDAFFIDDTNFSFFYFTIILICSGSACSLTKGEFLKIYLVLFLCCCIETMHTNPSYPSIPYLAMSLKFSSCFNLISEGGGRHCHDVFRRRGRLWLLLAVALLT
jgi:hypothetical protein